MSLVSCYSSIIFSFVLLSPLNRRPSLNILRIIVTISSSSYSYLFFSLVFLAIGSRAKRPRAVLFPFVINYVRLSFFHIIFAPSCACDHRVDNGCVCPFYPTFPLFPTRPSITFPVTSTFPPNYNSRLPSFGVRIINVRIFYIATYKRMYI